MNKKIIFSMLIAGALILGAVYAPDIKLPERWELYHSSTVGISFKYPPNFIESGRVENLIELSSYENNNYQGIKIDRYWGFGEEKTSENVFKELKLDPEPTIEKIKVGGKEAVVFTQPYDATIKTIYVLVDDALFIISLYQVDPEKFYKNLSFDGTQILSDYSTENIGTSTKRFTNFKYHYQINIPRDFAYAPRGSDVFFGAPFEGPGPGIGVYASTTPFIKPNDVIILKDKGVLEKEITIGGVKAIVTHAGDKKVEEFPDFKNTFFERAGVYYILNTQYVDHEAVWKSFKFIDE